MADPPAAPAPAQPKPCPVCAAAADPSICCKGNENGGCGEVRAYCSKECRGEDWECRKHRANCKSHSIGKGTALDATMFELFATRVSQWPGGVLPVQSVLDRRTLDGGAHVEKIAGLMRIHCIKRSVVAARLLLWKANRAAEHSGAGGAAPPLAPHQPPAAPRKPATARLGDVAEVAGDAVGGVLGSRVCNRGLACVAQAAAMELLAGSKDFLSFLETDLLSMCALADAQIADAPGALTEKAKQLFAAKVGARGERVDAFVATFAEATAACYPAAALRIAGTTAVQLLRHLYVEVWRQGWHAVCDSLNGGKFRVPESPPGAVTSYGRQLALIMYIAGWLLVREKLRSRSQRSGLDSAGQAFYLAHALGNSVDKASAVKSNMPVDVIEERSQYSRYEAQYPNFAMLELTDHLEVTTQAALAAGIVRETGGAWPQVLYKHLKASRHVSKLFRKTVDVMPADVLSLAKAGNTFNELVGSMKRHLLQGWVNMRCVDQAKSASKKNGTSDTTEQVLGARRQQIAAASVRKRKVPETI